MKPHTDTSKKLRIYTLRNEDGTVAISTTGLIPYEYDHVSQSSRKGNHMTPNSYSFLSQNITAPKGTQWGTAAAQRTYVYNGVVGDIPYSLGDIPPYGALIAYEKCLSRLNDKARSQVDLAVDAIQASQTRKMLNLKSTARDLIRVWRKSKFKALSSADLLWKYGWSPFMSTVFGLLDNSVKSYDKPITIRTRYTYREAFGTFNVVHGSRIYKGEMRSNRNYRCLLQVSLQAPTLPQQIADYTSLNPVSLAWEIIPYSFVFDWVYNVGGYLRALENQALFNSTFVSGFRSDSYKLSGTYSANGRGTGSYSVISASGRCAIKSHTRTVLTGWPAPNLPLVRRDYGYRHFETIIELIRAAKK